MHGTRTAGLSGGTEPIVVIDNPSSDLTLFDSRDDTLVVVVKRGVLLEPVQPVLGGCRPVELDDRAHDWLEVGLGRGDCQLALPGRLTDVEQGTRQLRIADHLRVVDERRLAGRDADPVLIGRIEPRGGTLLSVDGSTLASKPCRLSSMSGSEFSVSNTSAGVDEPSTTS